MTKLAPEWVRTSDPVIRSPARYRWTTAPAVFVWDEFLTSCCRSHCKQQVGVRDLWWKNSISHGKLYKCISSHILDKVTHYHYFDKTNLTLLLKRTIHTKLLNIINTPGNFFAIFCNIASDFSTHKLIHIQYPCI